MPDHDAMPDACDDKLDRKSHSSPHGDTSGNLYRNITFASVLWFCFTFIVVHIVRDDLSLWRQTLSIYAVGPAGWLLTTGFYSVALTQLLIAYRLFQLRQSAGDLLAVTLLVLTAVGVVLVAMFPYTIKTPHNIGAAMHLIFFPLFLWLRVWLHRNDALWTFSVVVAVLSTVALLLLIWNGETDYNVGTSAMAQKAEIIVIALWLLVYSWHLPASRRAGD